MTPLSEMDWNEIRAGVAYADTLPEHERDHVLSVLHADLERLLDPRALRLIKALARGELG